MLIASSTIARACWLGPLCAYSPAIAIARGDSAEQQLGPVLRGECDRLGDKRGGRRIVQGRWSLGSVRDRHADLLEEFLLACRRTETQQSRRPAGDVTKYVRRVGRHVDRVAGRGNGADASERELDLALEDGEHLLEVVTVGRRPAARRDVHVDQRVAPSGVGPGHEDRVGVANHAEVRQRVIGVGAHVRQDPPGVIGGDRSWRL